MMVNSVEKDASIRTKNLFAPNTQLDSDSERDEDLHYHEDFSFAGVFSVIDGSLKYMDTEYRRILSSFENPREAGMLFNPLLDFSKYGFASFKQVIRIVQLELEKAVRTSEGYERTAATLQQQLNNLKKVKIVHHSNLNDDFSLKDSAEPSGQMEAFRRELGSYKDALELNLEEAKKLKQRIFKKGLPDPCVQKNQLPNQATIIVHGGRRYLDNNEDAEKPMSRVTSNLITSRIDSLLDYNEHGFVVHNIFSTKGGFGISLPANQDLRKIAQILYKTHFFGAPPETLRVEVKEKLKRLAVPGLSRSLTQQGAEHLVELIRQQNLAPEAFNKIRSGTLNKKGNTLFLPMDQELYDILSDHGEVYIETFRYKVEEPFEYPLCFRCGGLNHFARNCTEKKEKACFQCGWERCAQRQANKPCFDKPYCLRCGAVGHSTFQIYQCPRGLNKGVVDAIRKDHREARKGKVKKPLGDVVPQVAPLAPTPKSVPVPEPVRHPHTHTNVMQRQSPPTVGGGGFPKPTTYPPGPQALRIGDFVPPAPSASIAPRPPLTHNEGYYRAAPGTRDNDTVSVTSSAKSRTRRGRTNKRPVPPQSLATYSEEKRRDPQNTVPPSLRTGKPVSVSSQYGTPNRPIVQQPTGTQPIKIGGFLPSTAATQALGLPSSLPPRPPPPVFASHYRPRGPGWPQPPPPWEVHAPPTAQQFRNVRHPF